MYTVKNLTTNTDINVTTQAVAETMAEYMRTESGDVIQVLDDRGHIVCEFE